MDLERLQAEVNHLLFLYYTSIGSLQRDAAEADVDIRIEDLVDEIKKCKNRIDALLCEKKEEKELPDDFYQVIESGKEFVEDGLYFINSIVGL